MSTGLCPFRGGWPRLGVRIVSKQIPARWREPCRKDPLRDYSIFIQFSKLTEKSNCDPQKSSLRKSPGKTC